MPRYHDAHVHLSKTKMARQLNVLRDHWMAEGVASVQCMSMTLNESRRALELAEPGVIFSGVAKHPWKAKQPLTEEEKMIFELLVRDERCSVIGEVGLDKHFVKKTDLYPHQQELLEFFVDLSVATNKPLNLHSTGAEEDVLEILRSRKIDGRLVNIHWFNGPSEVLEGLVDLGCYFSVGPAVHYTRHAEVVGAVPLDRLLSESDGDVRYKPLGYVGEPAVVPSVIRKVSEILRQDLEECGERLYTNAMRFLQVKTF